MLNSRCFKTVFLGRFSGGKTSIIMQYTQDEFSINYSPTIVANFHSKDITFGETEVTLHIWDTAGQEIYRSLAPQSLRNSHIAIIVFDLTSRESFDDINFWIDQIRNNTRELPYIHICGNKSDLNDQRVIQSEEGLNYASENGVGYSETSPTKKNIEHITCEKGVSIESSKTVF
jgi:Ras-related protein Rab-6A